MQHYQKSAKEVIREYQTSLSGLSSAEANVRKKKYGNNSIKVKGAPLWKKLVEPFADVFAIVLLGAAGISFWQNQLLDAIIILVVLAISATIFYVQRFSTERVLRNLNRQSVQLINTRRNGKVIKLDSAELVPGDIVSISEGEKVPADIRIIEESNLLCDESVLTGESLPVEKDANPLKGEKQIYERTNMLFSGAFVVGGQATGVVVSTGNNTEFGNLASLSDKTEVKSPVQKKIDVLVAKIVAIVGALSVVTFGIALARGLDMAESLRFVIALAVSAVPEGLPIAISVILVLGMRRMAAKKALVQQMRAIETLGVITTIATDKTGTLTENKLKVIDTWQAKKTSQLELALSRVFNRSGNLTDPLDKALMEHSRKAGLIKGANSPASEIPFEQEFAMSGTVWHDGDSSLIYIKGAPESIIKYSNVSATVKKSAESALNELTSRGLRVIGVATVSVKKAPENFAELTKHKLNFEGFVAVADTLRPEAISAIKTANSAGVSIRMITGDHAETAYQIGKSLGMVTDRSEVLDCREIESMSDRELTKIIDNTKVFARVIPEQKYRLLSLLKKHNITAMTGDGVNDVPALTNAHIGIAMGSGSSIAKDAGDIILLDDNFKTVIDAMREGRIVIANIRRMLYYLMATNAGELLTMIGALFVGTKLPLEPVQILWVNLVTDTSMVIPLGLEPGDKDVMRQKPIKPNAPLLSKALIVRMILMAVTLAVLTLATYVYFENSQTHAYAQTLTFAALITAQWASAFSARSDVESVFSRLKTMNKSFYIGLSISILIQLTVFFGPLGQALHVAPVSIEHLGIVSLIAFVVPLMVLEIHKWIIRRSQ